MEKEQLVDLSEVEIDSSLNKAERIHSFIEKVGNPYAFRVGNVEVRFLLNLMEKVCRTRWSAILKR